MKKALGPKQEKLATPRKEQKKSTIKQHLQQQELTFEELQLQDTPPKATKNLSNETQDVIKDILNDPQIEKDILMRPPRVSYEDLMKQELQMKFKHSELLSVTKELVLPAHYKVLLELQGFIDNSLNFLKQCRRQGGMFSEIKKSIEQTFGR